VTKQQKSGDTDMQRCFIFAAGTYYGLHERPNAGDLVIAADAGYRICQREGITPDLLLGDFDSMEEPADFPNIRRVPVEKDDTDTMLAAREAVQQGCEAVFLYGGTGGRRTDHTLANLQTLIWLRENGARGFLYDDAFVYTAIKNESFTVKKTVEWGLLSAFCFGSDAWGIDETGVQYPLRDAVLSSGFPLGVSNHILEDTACVTVREGTLIVGWQIAQWN
jgi:thiamine pyrophosphokinase